MSTAHASCTHPATSAARAKCRAARKSPSPQPQPQRLSRITFETETCTRCAGSGQYPSAAWQGRCLGCGGKGVRQTRRGKAACQRALAAARGEQVAVTDLAVGMRVLGSDGLSGRRITAVTPRTDLACSSRSGEDTQHGYSVQVSFAPGGGVMYPSYDTVTLFAGWDAVAASVARLAGATVEYR